MALITISMRYTPQSGTIVLHCTAHGVREGRYEDLWTRSTELTPDGPDTASGLRALHDWLETFL